MATRPPKIKVEKASRSVSGGSPSRYKGGLGRTQKLVDERKEQRIEQQQENRLNPRFPYSVVPFDPSFFNIPAAPVLLSDGSEDKG